MNPSQGRWFEVSHEDFEKKLAAIPPPAPSQQKIAIPPHLLKANAQSNRTRNGVKPVPKRGSRPKRDWQDTTIRDGINYGKKAWQLAKHLATLVNVEDKKWDVDGSASTEILSSATIVNLSNIAQGNDYDDRSGNSILGQAMEFRAALFGNTAAIGHTVRVMLVADRENAGTDPVIGDILQAGTLPFLQPINANSGNRFEILYDEVIYMQNVAAGLAASGTSTSYIPFRMNLPVLNRKWNKHIKYAGTTGADASNRENALFLVAISSSASSGPSLAYTFRLHFTDN